MSFKKDLNNIHDKSYKDLFSTNDTFYPFLKPLIYFKTSETTMMNNAKFQHRQNLI
ncbi:hypothetical protein [Clostridium estertheticum]|uniref:hypothetical protein n=1 Tax=Clostridium estertheticum TaxID=238834 RepID=UPI001CF1DD17|nr:hypothetical protein [Clostridium estertheticum]MCB2358696.1 hypothetical protein [Clostridium estertheticum]